MRRLLDIIENGRAILAYVDGLDAASFVGNRLVHDAVERWLERISEAAATWIPTAWIVRHFQSSLPTLSLN